MLQQTGPAPVDNSSPQSAPVGGSSIPRTGPAPTASSLPSTGSNPVRESTASSSLVSSRSVSTGTSAAPTTSSTGLPTRLIPAGNTSDLPLPATEPLTRSTSAGPTRISPSESTTCRASEGPVPGSTNSLTVPTTRTTLDDPALQQAPAPSVRQADEAAVEPMDEDPPQEAGQPTVVHDDDDESGISILSGGPADETAMQDQEDALRNEGHAAQERPPVPGPSAAREQDHGPTNEHGKSLVARGKRRRVEPPPDLEDGTDGKGPLWNKHFPLPDDAINSRCFVCYFTDIETELEAGFKPSSTPCEACRENKVWCTYGTGLDFNNNERGAGIDKCDFCKVRGRKCDLIPGKTTRRQKMDDSLKHVYKKLEKLSRRTNDRKMARTLVDLSREAEVVYRFYTKEKAESSSSPTDDD